jgi:hypothetical protein
MNLKIIETDKKRPLFLAFMNARLEPEWLPRLTTSEIKFNTGRAEQFQHATLPQIRGGHPDEKLVLRYLCEVLDRKCRLSQAGNLREFTVDDVEMVRKRVAVTAHAISQRRRYGEPGRVRFQSYGSPSGAFKLKLQIEVKEQVAGEERKPRGRGRPPKSEAAGEFDVVTVDTDLALPLISLVQYFKGHPDHVVVPCGYDQVVMEMPPIAGPEEDSWWNPPTCGKYVLARRAGNRRYCSDECWIAAKKLKSCQGHDGPNAVACRRYREKLKKKAKRSPIAATNRQNGKTGS